MGRALWVLLLCGCGRSGLLVPFFAEPDDGPVGGDMDAGEPPSPRDDGGAPMDFDAAPIDAAGDTGVEDDAAKDAGTDAGAMQTLRVEVFEPEPVSEAYLGEQLALRGRCVPVEGVALTHRGWRSLELPAGAAWETSEQETTYALEQLGRYIFEIFCEDELGAVASATVEVTVLDQPYLVYESGGQVMALRMDRSEPEELLAGSDAYLTGVSDARYALGGDVVITVATPTSDPAETHVEALYGLRGAQIVRHTLLTQTAVVGVGTPSIVVSKDGRYVAIGSWSAPPRIFHLEPDGPVEIEHELTARGTDIQLSDDGSWLLIGHDPQPTQLLAIESGEVATIAVPEDGIFKPRLAPDGRYVVFSDAAGGHVLLTDDAVLGIEPTLLEGHLGEATWDVDPAGDIVLAKVAREPGTEVFELDGRWTAALGEYVVRACGDIIVLVSTMGDAPTLLLVEDRFGVQDLDTAPAVTSEVLLDDDCSTLAYTSDEGAAVVELPPPYQPLPASAVQLFEGEAIAGLQTTASGVAVATLDVDTGAFRVRVGGAEVEVDEEPFHWLVTPDGRWLVSVSDAAYDEPPDSFLTFYDLTAPDPSQPVATSGSPLSSYQFFADPSGRYVLAGVRPTLLPDGVITGLDGLVEFDLEAANGPEPRPLLPERAARQLYPTELSRVPGRRAVLMAATAGVPCAQRVYARALVDGAETVEQALGGAPLGCTRDLLVSTTGEHFVIERELQGDPDAAISRLRLDPAEAPEVANLPIGADQVAAFYDDDRGLVVLENTASLTATALYRYDVAANGRTTLRPGALGRFEDVQVERETGRIFFTVAGTDSRVLYVHDPGDAAPRPLTPIDRSAFGVQVGPGFDWAMVQLVSGTDSQLIVLDERDAWTPHALDVPSMSYTYALFDNEQGGGVFASSWPGGGGTFAFRRGALDHRFDRAQQETVLRSTPLEVTADGMRGLFVGWFDARAGIYAYDLTSPTLDLSYLAPTLFGLAEQSLRRTPNPRFVSLARGSDLGLIDLEDGTRSRILPTGATRLEFDPLGRYLSYAIRTSSGIELHIETLDGSSPDRVIELRDLPWQALWVN